MKFYKPSKNEPYMNDDMLNYFKKLLLDQKKQLIMENNTISLEIKNQPIDRADSIDLSSQTSQLSQDLQFNSRKIKLMKKIDRSLNLIENKEFGYCLKTGEEIGIHRLLARPTAIYSIEIQEKIEKSNKNYLQGRNRF